VWGRRDANDVELSEEEIVLGEATFTLEDLDPGGGLVVEMPILRKEGPTEPLQGLRRSIDTLIDFDWSFSLNSTLGMNFVLDLAVCTRSVCDRRDSTAEAEDLTGGPFGDDSGTPSWTR
jgi:hypothetical protein